MVNRTFWINKIEEAWQRKNVLWISGIRRAGKTSLGQSLNKAEYFDCELPRTRQTLEDPEQFLDSVKGKRVILDEIHRLANPSQLLKIAADHFPSIKILATGSSTLGASSKFKDTLTGRKTELWLTPMTTEDLTDFNADNLKRRFLYGGLPPFFLSKKFPESDFQEWLDAYWAKDIQELFRLERRHSFQKFLELMILQSSGIFEASKFTQPCEASRQTISNYLKVLEATFVAHVLRPFHSNKSTEIIAAPKVYAFDTGFFCYLRGWQSLREDDLGILWEHFVLNEMQAHLQTRQIFYWRTKQGHEIDFILPRRGKSPVAVECKWSSGDIEEKNIRAFAQQYPDCEVFVVSHTVPRTFQRKLDKTTISFVDLTGLIQKLSDKRLK